MALLSGIDSISKGTEAILTLNKTELFALAAVSSDDWFSVQANVKLVKMIYKSTEGNQRKVIVFDASLASPAAKIYFSPTARNSFALDRIVLSDFDGDFLSLKGSDIPSGLGISLT